MEIAYFIKDNNVFDISILFEYFEEELYVGIKNKHIGEIVSNILNYDKPLYRLALQSYDEYIQNYIDIGNYADAILNKRIDIKNIKNDVFMVLYNLHEAKKFELGEETANHNLTEYIETMYNMADYYTSIRNKIISYKKFDIIDINETQKNDIKKFVYAVLCDDESTDLSNETIEERLYSFLSMYSWQYRGFLNYNCTTLTTTAVSLEKCEHDKWIEEVEPNLDKNFYQIINGVRNNNYHLKIITELTFSTFYDFIIFALTYMVNNNIKLKICGNCNKWFYPEKRSDAIFCDDISPQDNTKTCKEYGRYINQQNKIKETPTLQLRKQLYNKFRNQYNRDKTVENQERLNNFMNKSDRFKNDVKHNVKSESEYLEWLERVRETGEV